MIVHRVEGYNRTSTLLVETPSREALMGAACVAMQMVDDQDPKNMWGWKMEYIPGIEVVEYELVERRRMPAEEFFQARLMTPVSVANAL